MATANAAAKRRRRAGALALALGAVLAAPLAAGCRRGGGAEEERVASGLPGGVPRPASVAAALARAVEAKGPGYVPHTRHRDGARPKYTNRLVLEASPYLEQHAHNPVDWWPWGDAAFAEARRLGRPVLVSIGYSTCHWCHVMEEESFEDEAVAAELNARYVCIKVDREERPDLDAAYLGAVAALTGSGGWPLNVWVVPSTREPFFGGTYFPARDGGRGVAKGLVTVAREEAEAYARDPAGIERRAHALALAAAAGAARGGGGAAAAGGGGGAAAAGGGGTAAGPGAPSTEPLRLARRLVEQVFDPEHGGTRGAPKFPSEIPVGMLLRYHRRTGDGVALEMATRTLDGMAAGGLHDQLGGGFHRYSTDAAWRVPHFEKMLYDNAQLARAYVEAYQATGRADFARVAADTLEWMRRDLVTPGGGLASALDADAGGEEGGSYRWSRGQLRAQLGEALGERVARFYGVGDEPSVLAEAPGASDAERAALGEARARLLAARGKRPAPARDDKVLAGWNGLAISAFAVGGRVLRSDRWLGVARAAADAVLGRLREGGVLGRSYRAPRDTSNAVATSSPARAANAPSTRGPGAAGAPGAGSTEGFLEDYAMLVGGLLDLYEATFEVRWLAEAVALGAAIEARFAAPGGGFYETSAAQAPPFGARLRPGPDGPEPSGASVATLDLLRLAAFTDEPRFRDAAARALAAAAADLAARPLAHAELLLALDFATDAAREVVVVWPAAAPAPEPLLAVLRTTFLPSAVLAGAAEGPPLDALTRISVLGAGKRALHGAPTAYVCEHHACRAPTPSPTQLAADLAPIRPL